MGRGFACGCCVVAVAASSSVASAQPGSDYDPSSDESSARRKVLATEPPDEELCERRCECVSAEELQRHPCMQWCGKYPSFDEKHRVPIGVDLLPEIGTSAGYEDNHVRHLSLNLIGGYSGGLEGLELSTLFTFTTSHVYGVQVGGLANFGGGRLYGLQAVGVLNVAASSPYGLQAAGVMNITGGVPRGLQLAGGANLANDGVHGAQLAGAVNMAGGLDGAQVASNLNILDSESGTGAQVAAVNITSGGLDGAQVGAVNVSGPGRTNVQVGVINVAEESDFSLGLINVLYGGRTHVDVWFAETGFVHAGLKHGGRWFHNIYGLGARWRGGPQGSLAFGIGTHLPLPLDGLYLDVDLIGHAILPDYDEGDSVPVLGTLRAVANGRMADVVSLYGGLSYNVLYTEESDRGQSYPLFGSHEIRATDESVVLGWPGLVLGLQFLPEE